jgi:hypothetical protein
MLLSKPAQPQPALSPAPFHRSRPLPVPFDQPRQTMTGSTSAFLCPASTRDPTLRHTSPVLSSRRSRQLFVQIPGARTWLNSSPPE